MDPTATTLAMQVDAIRAVKKGVRGKMSPSDVWDSIIGYWLTQPADKTSFSGFQKLTAVLDSFTPGASSGERERAIKGLFGNMLTGLTVPNLVKQPLRTLDDYQRDTAG